jgi:hypothetical protein
MVRAWMVITEGHDGGKNVMIFEGSKNDALGYIQANGYANVQPASNYADNRVHDFHSKRGHAVLVPVESYAIVD